MPPRRKAFVAHRTPNRIRIKFRQRGQAADLAALQRSLAEHWDIMAVEANPLTGSVVIHCRQDFDIAAVANRFLDFEAPPRSGSQSQSQSLHIASDRRGAGISPTSSDLLRLALKLLIAAATNQLGAQLREWMVDGLVQALTGGAKRIPPSPRRLGSSAALLVSAAE